MKVPPCKEGARFRPEMTESVIHDQVKGLKLERALFMTGLKV